MIWKKRSWAVVRWACLVAANEGLHEFDVHHMVKRAFGPIRSRQVLKVERQLSSTSGEPPATDADLGSEKLEANGRTFAETRGPSGPRQQEGNEHGSLLDHAFAACRNGHARIEK